MNTSTYNRTRWLTLFGTIVTQFALGSVYTWSLFNSALSDKTRRADKPGGVLLRLC